MRYPKPGAVVVTTDAYGRETERAAFTCRHCGSPTVVPDGRRIEDVSAVCARCGLICARCARLGAVLVEMADGSVEEFQRCVPFERQVERMEERGRRLREMGIGS